MWDRVGWMETLVLPEVGPWDGMHEKNDKKKEKHVSEARE